MLTPVIPGVYSLHSGIGYLAPFIINSKHLVTGRSRSVAEAVEHPETLVIDDPKRTKGSVMATTLIGAHGLEHMYAHSFPVLVTAIYESWG